VQACLVEEPDRRRVAAVLAADADHEARVVRAPRAPPARRAGQHAPCYAAGRRRAGLLRPAATADRPSLRPGKRRPAGLGGAGGALARHVRALAQGPGQRPRHALKAGCWVEAEQPQAADPASWTRQACAAWVAAVDRMKVGDYLQRTAGLKDRFGKPLEAATKAGHLLRVTEDADEDGVGGTDVGRC
jgi:hypothetical protein